MEQKLSGEVQIYLPLESLVSDKRARTELLKRFNGDEKAASAAVIEATLGLWHREAKLAIKLDSDPRLNAERGQRKIAVAEVKIQPPRFNDNALAEEGVRGAIEGTQALARKYNLPFEKIVRETIGEKPE